MNSFFKAQVLTASVLCVLIAVVFDLLLLGVERLLTPWRRAGRTARPRVRTAGGAVGRRPLTASGRRG